MPTSYTSNLKLALPATGELDGTWGTVVNENITSMIEEALTALASVSSWSSNAATITTANGVTSAGRAMMLDLSGTLTAAGTLTVPTANKMYIVRNGTTGGYAVTVKMASGTGFSVPNGAVLIVYSDGTNVVRVAGDVTLDGTQTLTNKTLTTPVINGFTGDTSIVNLGSGQFYKDASGNVGIGTSSPGYKITVASGALGTTSGNSLSALQLQATSANVDTLDFKKIRTSNGGNWETAAWRLQQRVDSTDMAYIQFNGTGLDSGLSFGTNNTERMRIISSGNVGIGTTTGPEKLTVGGGNIRLQTDNKVRLEYLNSTGSYVLGTTGGAALVFENISGSHEIAFETHKSGHSHQERMRIDSSGNLLVGKTSNSYTTVGVLLNPTAFSQFTHATAGQINIACTAPVSEVQIAFYRQDTGGLMGVISNGASNTVIYSTSSDYRLKENVQPMVGALSRVMQLKPCTFTWKGDGVAGEGFIAHELQGVVPQAVTGAKDAVGKDGKPAYQGVDASFVVSVLSAGLQELES